jgi:TfoX/Sxy family transcriptional regulator of competence genes
MAYDEVLAERIRRVLGARAGVTEKAMFGGIAFLLRGKMFCGIAKGALMVRVGPEKYEELLGRRHVRPMDFTGRPLTGYVYVDPPGLGGEKALREWVERGASFVETLAPPKARARPVKKKRAGSAR